MAPKKGSIAWNRGLTKRPPIKCEFCGKETKKRRYCSQQCAYADPKRKERIRQIQLNLKYEHRNCLGCSEVFSPHNFRQKFCKACANNGSMRARIQRYRLSGPEVTALFEKNDGICELCHREAKYIDHDHTTGDVRGALCPGCNTALSRVDEEGWIERALKYVNTKSK